MLSIVGQSMGRFCDGMPRRDFLRIGTLGVAGLTLPDLLRAEEKARVRNSHKSVIMVFLPGGPPHLDMFDLKPGAPAEVRGEFNPIATKVPGIQICELMPRLAAIMDKVALLRTVAAFNDHAAFHCLTGRPRNLKVSPAPQADGGWPALGSVLSKVHGPVLPSVPPFISLTPKMVLETWDDPGSPGFLGLAHAPLRPAGPALGDMVLRGMSDDCLRDRRSLLSNFDNFRRETDRSGTAAAMDKFTERGLGILTSRRLVDALDLTREDPKVRARYGKGRTKLEASSNDDYPATGDLEHFLIARRLVEAGARCVTMNFGKYDWHSNNFREAKKTLPMLDHGVAALIQDLHDRVARQGCHRHRLGRIRPYPRINNNDGGRDHWPEVMSVLLAGRDETWHCDRLDQPPGRVCEGTTDPPVGGLRNLVPQSGDRPEATGVRRPIRPDSTPTRRPPADRGTGWLTIRGKTQRVIQPSEVLEK